MPAEIPPVTSWPAHAIAAGVRRGELTAAKVLQAHLDQVRAKNAELNAIVTLTEDSARTRAAAIDDAVAAGIDPGPLAGVPFTVKDLIVTEGVRSTAGSLLMQDYVPAWSATAVNRLVEAGAVLIGKSNCPEFGLDLHTHNRLFGETVNPLDPGLSPGGSSGGDAAAVAAGMAAFGIGTDYGGSIRLPAHCTGLASLKPTPGLVPGTGQLPFWPAPHPVPPRTSSLQGRLQAIGPIARSAADLWTLLEVMSGPDGIDPSVVAAAPVPARSVELRDLPVAWCGGDGSYPVRDDVISVVEAAARALKPAVGRIAAIRPPGLDQAEAVYAALRAYEDMPVHRELAAGREQLLTGYVRDLLLAVPPPANPGRQQELNQAAADIRARIGAFMREWPILLLPVASVPAYKRGLRQFVVHGTTLTGPQVEGCCRAVTLLGAPSAVVRCGYSADGLPVGVQVVARPFHDAEAVAVATELERRLAAAFPGVRSGR